MNIAYNMDCMEGMKQYPDKYFELAIVDPPYGDVEGKGWDRFGSWFNKYKRRKKPDGKKQIGWDVAPPEEYFVELFRVSKNQIIWGGNYFDLPPTRCFLVWRKISIAETFSMAMCEYAWTSFNDRNAKFIEIAPQGTAQEPRFHPTQKPIKLYEWILANYAEKGDKILDTHMGSGSSRIACWNFGFDFTGYEIDKEYFDKQEERFKKHTRQQRLDI